MKTIDLCKQYPNGELTCVPGDAELRCKAYTPLFENLYENKMVYSCYSVTHLIQIENLIITSEGFKATANKLCLIGDGRRKKRGTITDLSHFEFSCRWDWLRLINGCFCPYYLSDQYWVDYGLVKTIEELVLQGKNDEALNLTVHIS